MRRSESDADARLLAAYVLTSRRLGDAQRRRDAAKQALCESLPPGRYDADECFVEIKRHSKAAGVSVYSVTIFEK